MLKPTILFMPMRILKNEMHWNLQTHNFAFRIHWSQKTSFKIVISCRFLCDNTVQQILSVTFQMSDKRLTLLIAQQVYFSLQSNLHEALSDKHKHSSSMRPWYHFCIDLAICNLHRLFGEVIFTEAADSRWRGPKIFGGGGVRRSACRLNFVVGGSATKNPAAVAWSARGEDLYTFINQLDACSPRHFIRSMPLSFYNLLIFSHSNCLLYTSDAADE